MGASLVNDRVSILVVDDEPTNLDAIEILLSKSGYQLSYAANGHEALNYLAENQPDAILLDVMMPGLDGIEVCHRIKANPHWQHIPVIMVTALSAKEDLADCMEAGADDFISKPVNGIELRSRVRSMLRLGRQYKDIQSLNQQLQQANHELAELNGILEERVLQRTAQLERMVLYDNLTQLPSRNFLLRQLEQAIQRSLNEPDYQFALVYIDCDRFNLINGSLGYDVGDKLLIAIGDRLSTYSYQGSLLSRLGEDKFCYFLDEVKDLDRARQISKEILQTFSAPFTVEGCDLFISASMGIVMGSSYYRNPSDPLQDASTAACKAKTQGQGGVQVFDRAMHSAAVKRLLLENDLRRAVEAEEFQLYYQPIVDLKTGRISSFEALIRWLHPRMGVISPVEFIPCVEETGLIVPIGLQILKRACKQIQTWQQLGVRDPKIGVNLSVRQFAHPLLLDELDLLLQETGVLPIHLQLEITESAIMDNAQAAIAIAEQLRFRQIHLSIDDFGTGYSSLSYLNHFPVNSLKIDRSFIRTIGADRKSTEIVQAILTLGHALNMKVVAEGIETAEQHDCLCRLGCDLGQGFFFAKPLTEPEATELILRQQ
ncbi:EAL domain-containing response regulator [Pseudanabaena sp. PCC 6802]|uniref:EAL domain-containing response regulator n=1 Tax=Pseudanabaena sp. PCC 6802 TaxID=118173 RepID=UPI000345FDF4|nr:EAL domain-containing response regulator [Pseudanabaena sp. PCC 6802]